MILFPNAKINIGLNIIEKRNDGFHNLETLFYPVGLSDVLEIVEQPGDKKTAINITGININGASDHNLCLKAYHLLKKDYSLPELNIHLHKVIPVGAGLGGGSADGAFMLTLLNQTFKLGIPDKQLENFASKLGSDCAFFIKNKPAFAKDKGDKLLPAPISLAGCSIVLVFPNLHIGTAEAYASIKPAIPKIPLVKRITETPVEEWKHVITNDFEPGIFRDYPELKLIKDLLYQNGALYASMSGSGSAIYGIFRETGFNFRSIFKNYSSWYFNLE
ncbi:MAG: 4-(cytidine 5'-diphospho)-2-C-methyl-D-erythritol kinase [Bacteroidales bacterium]|nr:4-(cytidine 5'-diphospho)-2-C-methyl-D-erythritol kinase [Bacteroidales bacterium]